MVANAEEYEHEFEQLAGVEHKPVSPAERAGAARFAWRGIQDDYIEPLVSPGTSKTRREAIQIRNIDRLRGLVINAVFGSTVMCALITGALIATEEPTTINYQAWLQALENALKPLFAATIYFLSNPTLYCLMSLFAFLVLTGIGFGVSLIKWLKE